MKTFAIGFLTASLVACATTQQPASVAASPKHRDYLATALSDGSIEIIVKGKAALPTGNEVAVISLRDKLAAAAAIECPGAAGYDLTLDKSTGIAVDPNGNLVTKQRAVVRCK